MTLTVTVPVWLLWTLGIGAGAIVCIILGIFLAAFILNNSGGCGPWR